MLWLDEEFPSLSPEKRPSGDSETVNMEEQPLADSSTSGVSIVHNIKDRNRGVGLKL